MKKAFSSDKDDLNICPCTRWTRADSLHDQRCRAAFKCLHLIGVPSESPEGIHPVPATGFSSHPPLQEPEPVPRSCRQACGQPCSPAAGWQRPSATHIPLCKDPISPHRTLGFHSPVQCISHSSARRIPCLMHKPLQAGCPKDATAWKHLPEPHRSPEYTKLGPPEAAQVTPGEE